MAGVLRRQTSENLEYRPPGDPPNWVYVWVRNDVFLLDIEHYASDHDGD